MEHSSDPHIRFVRIGRPGQPPTLLSWLSGVLVGTGMIALAILFFTFFLAVLGVGVVVVPIYLWWKRRNLPPRDARAPSGEGERQVIIDVEGEVSE